ncbi:4027_t:CDS:2 [Gigaspora margarita]|uniref:4027_t:CDS:1 n=1 Tax=Gigaspora margarita TaxID=4874 RepID=A0ABN7VMA9_GIGMA|nr:4027_t:CDS:2 [Gigaspora margarita]
MNQDNLKFTSATQLYNLRLHKQTNDSLDSNITFDEEIRFVAPSQSDIDHTINYASVKNTSHNTKTWVNTINQYFKDTNLTGDITQIKDCSELETILKKDGLFYAPKSIHNCYCGISRHLQMNSCQNPKLNILDKNQFSCLYSTIDGKIKLHLLEDTPASITYQVYFWLCLLGRLRGGLKNLNNSGRVCQIPPDMDDKFAPVSDILYYSTS